MKSPSLHLCKPHEKLSSDQTREKQKSNIPFYLVEKEKGSEVPQRAIVFFSVEYTCSPFPFSLIFSNFY